MKKYIFILMAVVLAVTACNEQEQTKLSPTPETSQVETISSAPEPDEGGPKRLRCTWTDWGRAKKGCDGGGLCNWDCEWEDVPVDNPASTIFNDFAKRTSTGDYYLEIPISSSMPAENNYQTFPVDEDIYYTSSTGDIWLMEAGEYPIDLTIGNQGGYNVPLIKYN
jgi:hypothetical protein